MDLSRREVGSCLIALAATVLAVLLAIENYNLKVQINAEAKLPVPGDEFGPVVAKDINGNRQIFSPFSKDGKGVVLFIFTTSCKVCASTQPVWDQIFQKNSDRFEFYGIALEKPGPQLKEYLETTGVKFPVLCVERDDAIKKLKTFQVPTTIVLERGGIVKYAWRGELNVSKTKEIARFFRL